MLPTPDARMSALVIMCDTHHSRRSKITKPLLYGRGSERPMTATVSSAMSASSSVGMTSTWTAEPAADMSFSTWRVAALALVASAWPVVASGLAADAALRVYEHLSALGGRPA